MRDVEAAIRGVMVLPGRIELTTSPLPRGCSTTELRQQKPRRRLWKTRSPEAGGTCHKGCRGARIVVATVRRRGFGLYRAPRRVREHLRQSMPVEKTPPRPSIRNRACPISALNISNSAIAEFDWAEREKIAPPGLAPALPTRLSRAMTKAGSTEHPAGPRPNGSKSARRDARAERLAAALKANLRRRKVQARERAAGPAEPDHDTAPAGSHDSARVVVGKRPG